MATHKDKAVASDVRLEALALDHNLWQFYTEYKEELREKNDQLQAQLRKKLGEKFEVFIRDIVAQTYVADVLIKLKDKMTRIDSALRVAMDSRARDRDLVAMWDLVGNLSNGLKDNETIRVGIDAIDNANFKLALSFNEFNEKVQAQRNQRAMVGDTRAEASPAPSTSNGGSEYELVAAMENPACKRAHRVEARRADMKVYFDNLINMSDAQLKSEKGCIDQRLDEVTAGIRMEEKRFRIFEYIQGKGHRDGSDGVIESRDEAIKDFDALLLELELTCEEPNSGDKWMAKSR